MNNQYKRVTPLALSLLFAMATASAGTAHPHRAAQLASAEPPSKIPTVGITADQRYPVYKLSGAVNGAIYVSGAYIFSNSDLVKRMVYVLPSDVRGGKYACGFICKNEVGQVIGLNPLYDGVMYSPLHSGSSS